MQPTEFVGNKKIILVLTSWLNDCYCEPNQEYCILFGDSGNGKTTLVKLLADTFDAELFLVTPYDIKSEKDLNNIIKSINTQPMFNSRKLIGIDEIDEFSNSYQKALMQIKSSYPVIYTSKTYAMDRDFINKSFKIVNSINGRKDLLKVKKPLPSELLEHLKSISTLPEETLEKIAKESRSFRSAVLAVQSGDVNELVTPYETNAEFLKRVKERRLERNLNRSDIEFIFRSIKSYDEPSLRVMLKLAEFDYRCKVQFQEIEPFEVNNMLEPLEQVKFEYKYNGNKQSKKVEKKPVVEQKKEPATIDKWI